MALFFSCRLYTDDKSHKKNCNTQVDGMCQPGPTCTLFCTYLVRIYRLLQMCSFVYWFRISFALISHRFCVCARDVARIAHIFRFNHIVIMDLRRQRRKYTTWRMIKLYAFMKKKTIHIIFFLFIQCSTTFLLNDFTDFQMLYATTFFFFFV